MSAHQPATAAVRRDGRGASEPSPTMNQLLAACAAASAVSTPPEPPARAEAAEEDTEDGAPKGDGARDAA